MIPTDAQLDLTVPQLRARLAERGIIASTKAVKSKLLQLLADARPEAPDYRATQQLRRQPVTVYQPWGHLTEKQQSKAAAMPRHDRRHRPVIIQRRLVKTVLVPKRFRVAGTMLPVTRLELAKAKVAAHS